MSILSIFGYKNSKKYVNEADAVAFYFAVCGMIVTFARHTYIKYMDDRSRERFEALWREQGYRLLREDGEYRQLSESFRLKTGGDFLLFGIPLLVGVVFMDMAPIERELLRWLATAAVVVVAFVLCVWVKSATGGSKSAAEVERRVKERCYERFRQTGSL